MKNVSIPAGNDEILKFDVPLGVELQDSIAYWRLFDQKYGCPLPDVDPILIKSSMSGGGINISESPRGIDVLVDSVDTILLLRNYFYELKIVSGDEQTHTIIENGIFTVTQTEIREDT